TSGRRLTSPSKPPALCGLAVHNAVPYTWKVDATAPVLAHLPPGGDLGCNPTPPTCSTSVTASDNCDGDVSATVTCDAGLIEDVGTCGKRQTFTYKAHDLCGNAVTNTVTYTWKVDTTAPVLANLPTGGSPEENPSPLQSLTN